MGAVITETKCPIPPFLSADYNTYVLYTKTFTVISHIATLKG